MELQLKNDKLQDKWLNQWAEEKLRKKLQQVTTEIRLCISWDGASHGSFPFT